MLLYVDKHFESSSTCAISAVKTFCKINGIEACLGEYSHDENGCPYIKGFSGYISVSHSNKTCVIAVSKHRIGVDIEAHNERDFELLGARLFGVTDCTKGYFYKFWTTAEAVSKYVGEKFIFNKTIRYLNLAKDLSNETLDFLEGYTLTVISKFKEEILLQFKTY